MKKVIVVSIIVFSLMVLIFSFIFIDFNNLYTRLSYSLKGAEYLGEYGKTINNFPYIFDLRYGDERVKPHDTLLSSIINYEIERGGKVFWSKDSREYYLWESWINYTNGVDPIKIELLVMDKEKKEIKTLVIGTTYYKTPVYRYNDDYIFFTTKDLNEPSVYIVKDKKIEKIAMKRESLGLPNDLTLSLKDSDIFQDTLYFSTYPKRYEKDPIYLLSYNFRTHEFKKVFKLKYPSSEVFIDNGYLYFESGSICSIFACLPTIYRIQLK